MFQKKMQRRTPESEVQNPLVVRVPPPTTLLRGRTLPVVEGRAGDDATLLAVVDCAAPDGFPADAG